MRLRISEERARAYVERETKAFERGLLWKQMWGNLSKAAAAVESHPYYYYY